VSAVNTKMIAPPMHPEAPTKVAVASLLIPGLGQILLGQRAKGAFFIVLTLLSCGLAYLLSPALAWDAHVLARRQGAGEEIDPWGFF